MTSYKDVACVRAYRARDDPQKRAFAGAVWSEQSNDLTGRNIELDPFENFEIPKELSNPLDGQARAGRASLISPWRGELRT
jgi:hypothetical protein